MCKCIIIPSDMNKIIIIIIIIIYIINICNGLSDYLVGSVFPLSGGNSITGTLAYAGALLGFETLANNSNINQTDIPFGSLTNEFPYYIDGKSFTFTEIVNDSQTLTATTARAVLKQLEGTWFSSSTKRPTTLTIGEIGSGRTIPAAIISSSYSYPLISPFATSPELSDTNLFSTFCRVAPSDVGQANTILDIIKRFKWKRIGLIYADDAYGRGIYDSIASGAITNNIEITIEETFQPEIATDTSINEMVKRVKSKSLYDAAIGNQLPTRVIVLIAAGVHAQLILKNAYDLQIIGDQSKISQGFTWIGVDGWADSSLFTEDLVNGIDTNAIDKIKKAAQGVIASQLFVESPTKPLLQWLHRRWNESKPYFAAKFNRSEEFFSELIPAAMYSFETVWVIAKAINNIMQNNGGQHIADNNRTQIIEAIKNLQIYHGITGEVAFWSTCDRRPTYSILNYQNTLGEFVSVGTSKFIGDNFDETNIVDIDISIMKFADNTNTAPSDQNITKLLLVSKAFQAIAYALAALTIFIAVGILIFLLVKRKNAAIRLSSPGISIVTVIGTMIISISIICLATQGRIDDSDLFAKYCSARLWLLSTGFTLVFVPLLGKTYRVHKIFNTRKLLKMKKIGDSAVFAFIGIFLLLDVIILTLQSIFSSPRSELTLDNSSIAIGKNIEVIEEVYLSCTANNFVLWIGTLALIKAAILIFGGWLAFQVRKVEIDALNDSKYIGFSIYNVLIVSFLLGGFLVLVDISPDSTLILFSVAVTICLIIVLTFLFLPKIIAVVQGKTKNLVSSHAAVSHDEKKTIRQLEDQNFSLKTYIERLKRIALLLDPNVDLKSLTTKRSRRDSDIARKINSQSRKNSGASEYYEISRTRPESTIELEKRGSLALAGTKSSSPKHQKSSSSLGKKTSSSSQL